jgi:hypothetical protein
MEGKDHVEDSGIYRRIILNGSKRNGIGGSGLDSSGPGYSERYSFECCSEYLGFMKRGEFVDLLMH